MSYFVKHINPLAADFTPAPSTKPGAMANGYASVSTSTEHEAKEKVKKEKSNAVTKAKEISNMKILSTIAKYVWMKDNFEFKMRVVAALGFLAGAKVLNVQGPFLFKLAVDWLTTTTGDASSLATFTTANSTALALFVSPVAVLVGYGIARTGASAFNGTSS